MPFEKRLYELRSSRFVTKTRLAEEIGTSRQMIRRYENGDAVPNILMLIGIADFFDVSADYLLGRDKFVVTESSEKPKT